jgi:AraC family transcriptional regulator
MRKAGAESSIAPVSGDSLVADLGAYGQRLADVFQLERAPAFVTHSLQKSQIAVTEIKCDIVDNGLTAPIPREDAFLVTLQLRDCPRHDLFIDDRAMRTGHLRVGAVSIYDLRTNPIANSISPFHSLHFYIPRRAFDLIADMEGCSRVDEFRNDPGLGAVDPCLGELGTTLLPTFRRPEEASQIFVDYITIAVAAHSLKTYGTSSRPIEPMKTALAPSQERRAKEMLRSRLDGEILVSDLANECGLSLGMFLRAFRVSTGTTPHRWLQQQRVDRAKSMLRRNPEVSLQNVALTCGFASESHLVRTFKRLTDTHPGAWRQG